MTQSTKVKFSNGSRNKHRSNAGSKRQKQLRIPTKTISEKIIISISIATARKWHLAATNWWWMWKGSISKWKRHQSMANMVSTYLEWPNQIEQSMQQEIFLDVGSSPRHWCRAQSNVVYQEEHATKIRGNAAGHQEKSERDKYGRYTWMKLQGRYVNKPCKITAYRVVGKGHTSGSCRLWDWGEGDRIQVKVGNRRQKQGR